MRIVIIPRDENGQYVDPVSEQEYDLIEVDDSSTNIATNKTIIEDTSADDYAFSQGWNKQPDDIPVPE